MTVLTDLIKILFGLSLFFVLSIPYVYAINIDTDQTTYSLEDKIIVSGNVESVTSGKFVGLQIRSSNDLVQLDQFLPSSDGSFSKEYVAKGAKWSSSGPYTIIVAYEGQTASSTFQFNSEAKPESNQILTPKKAEEFPIKPKIPDFPAVDKSPQYYFDRYQNEPVFKEWFDKIFHGYTVQDIVGYEKTHIAGFPDITKSRQHYLDRYNNEEKYKEWFDSQFPGKSIYDFFEISKEKIPNWIKDSAKEWAKGQISDSDFIVKIKYLVEKNIIKPADIPLDMQSDEAGIPNWIRNNASWWASGQITENEFVNSIKYLIENKIIILD